MRRNIALIPKKTAPEGHLTRIAVQLMGELSSTGCGRAIMSPRRREPDDVTARLAGDRIHSEPPPSVACQAALGSAHQFYFKVPAERQHSATVVRCRFDGETLRYVEHGDEMTINVQRGFTEPSLAQLKGRFFLTLRNDEHGHVTSGPDGLRFVKCRRPKRTDSGGCPITGSPRRPSRSRRNERSRALREDR